MSAKRNLAAMLIAAGIVVAGDACAQAPDYYQTGAAGEGHGNYRLAGSANENRLLVVDRLPPTFRVPVRTTPDQPVSAIVVNGSRNVYCALLLAPIDGPVAPDYITRKSTDSGGELNFKERLYRRLVALDSAAMRNALQRAAKGDRAAAYRELFGVELPQLTGEWTFTVKELPIREPQQMQLNIGSEAKVDIESVVCATPVQVDAAIAAAKQVYAAVIATLEGGGTKGLTTSAPSSSGLQTQNPKGK
jgi:hypothetical protein